MLHCMSPLLAQSGHETSRLAALRKTAEPHFAGRKSLL